MFQGYDCEIKFEPLTEAQNKVLTEFDETAKRQKTKINWTERELDNSVTVAIDRGIRELIINVDILGKRKQIFKAKQ